MHGHQDPDTGTAGGVDSGYALDELGVPRTRAGELHRLVTDHRELAERTKDLFGHDDLLGSTDDAMTEALNEFKSAAREAQRTQLAAQNAAKRYAAAIKRMSELAVQEGPDAE